MIRRVLRTQMAGTGQVIIHHDDGTIICQSHRFYPCIKQATDVPPAPPTSIAKHVIIGRIEFFYSFYLPSIGREFKLGGGSVSF